MSRTGRRAGRGSFCGSCLAALLMLVPAVGHADAAAAVPAAVAKPVRSIPVGAFCTAVSCTGSPSSPGMGVAFGAAILLMGWAAHRRETADRSGSRSSPGCP